MKRIIIDCVKNKDGTFIPAGIIKPGPVNKTIYNQSVQNRANQNIQEFISGVDAGLEVFEYIIIQLNRFGVK